MPSDAEPLDFALHDGTRPQATWSYHDKDDQLLGYMAEFDYGGGVVGVLPLTYCETGGPRRWHSKGFPSPYALYSSPDLVKRPLDPVLVVEGERAAEAAKVLLPNFVVTTSPYGFSLAHNADWTLLARREVLICPDYSRDMYVAAQKYATVVESAGAHSVRLISPKNLACYRWQNGQRVDRPVIPAGWNLGNAINDGWTPETFGPLLSDWRTLLARAKNLKFDTPGTCEFKLDDSGLWAEWIDRFGEPHCDWICDALSVLAETRDETGENWGKKFTFRSRDGLSKEVIGLPDASSHTGRRTFITSLAERGVDLKAISVLAGHSNIRTTALYVDASPQKLARILSDVAW